MKQEINVYAETTGEALALFKYQDGKVVTHYYCDIADLKDTRFTFNINEEYIMSILMIKQPNLGYTYLMLRAGEDGPRVESYRIPLPANYKRFGKGVENFLLDFYKIQSGEDLCDSLKTYLSNIISAFYSAIDGKNTNIYLEDFISIGKYKAFATAILNTESYGELNTYTISVEGAIKLIVLPVIESNERAIIRVIDYDSLEILSMYNSIDVGNDAYDTENTSNKDCSKPLNLLIQSMFIGNQISLEQDTSEDIQLRTRLALDNSSGYIGGYSKKKLITAIKQCYDSVDADKKLLAHYFNITLDSIHYEKFDKCYRFNITYVNESIFVLAGNINNRLEAELYWRETDTEPLKIVTVEAGTVFNYPQTIKD